MKYKTPVTVDRDRERGREGERGREKGERGRERK